MLEKNCHLRCIHNERATILFSKVSIQILQYNVTLVEVKECRIKLLEKVYVFNICTIHSWEEEGLPYKSDLKLTSVRRTEIKKYKYLVFSLLT